MTPPKLNKLVDAQAMHRQHPDTFDAPTDHELAMIKPGDFVKVCRANERFWCRVLGGTGRMLIAEIDIPLVSEGNADINHAGMIFRIEYRHIHTIHTV